jgi:predicted TIM-barrel fold metal-dependent hydrolase
MAGMMSIIDAHNHYASDHPRILSEMERMDLKIVNIAVAGSSPHWRERAELYERLSHQHPDRYAWITSFELPHPAVEPDYHDRVIAEMERDLTVGRAIGVKAWKCIGMEIKDADGRFRMIDDEVFRPIFEYLERTDRTVCFHLGEPLACWLPLDPNNAHYHYYSQFPEWHMHGRNDFPSHQQINDARDRILQRHPKLRVVGAHLGSMEYDLKVMADHFDRYPNLALDTSARLLDLTYFDSANVREFFIRYLDRLLFGIDTGYHQRPGATDQEMDAVLAEFRAGYQRELDYYGSDKQVKIGKRTAKGLALPAQAQDKLFRANALRWYPGLQQAC